MELVNYSDDEGEDAHDSSEEKTENIEVPKVLQSRWTAADDSEDEAEERNDDKPSVVKPKSASVLDLLSSSQKPSFLVKQSEQQFQLKPVIVNDYSVKPKVPIIEQPTPQELAKSNMMSRAEFEEIAKSKAVAEMVRSAAEEDIPLNAKVTSVKRTDKESAKVCAALSLSFIL